MMGVETIIKEHKGWVINTRRKDGHELIGKYWVFKGRIPIIFQHMDGYLAAVFKTRREARIALDDVRRSFPDARVERVTVTISKEFQP